MTNTALLDTVASAEQTLATLRRGLLAGMAVDTEAIAGKLTALASQLRAHATFGATQPVDAPAPVALSQGDVTQHVTESPNVVSRRRTPGNRATRRPPATINPDAVRVARSPDYATSGAWRVLLDIPGRQPAILGTLTRGGTNHYWTARDDQLVEIPGRCRTRQEALVRLVQHHQDRATSVARPRY